MQNAIEVVKLELDRMGIRDINNVQALILYNIGNDELTVGELTCERRSDDVDCTISLFLRHGAADRML